ncbi:MAG: hypothetical protein LBF40_00770, partial [Deltaproteobacteria bacterium]|nr:hypothetical protein [Deltaproteobacteria bacterium]
MIVPTPRTALFTAASAPLAGVILTALPEYALAAFILPVAALLLFLCDCARAPNPGLLRAALAPPGALSSGRSEDLPITVTLAGRKRPLRVTLLLSTAGEVAVGRKGGAGPASGKAGGDRKSTRL